MEKEKSVGGKKGELPLHKDVPIYRIWRLDRGENM